MSDPKGAVRILHLEDSDRDAALVSDRLEQGGLLCRIVLTQDREGFEAALDEGPWDLVFCDYGLPGYSGLSALKRSLEAHPMTPVIMFSGSIRPEEAVECMRAGATDYLLKDRPERLVSAVSRALQEVQERRRLAAAENALRENEERMRLAFAATGMEAWDMDLRTRRIRTSEAAAQRFWDAQGGVERDLEEWLLRIHPEDRDRREAAFEAMLKDGNRYHVEYRRRLPDGQFVWAAVWGELVRDGSGRPARVIGVSQEITERKKAEAAIRASLREKEALLKEVHHRVKNNLQVITSLLRLEAGRAGDPSAVAAFTGMTNRIHSMALLHETLYRSGHFDDVRLDDYLGRILSNLLRSHGSRPRTVELTTDLAEVEVNIDQAIPCGLIVNELATNSLAHAFPPGRPGGIHLAISRMTERDEIQVRFSDSGVGLPTDFQERRERSLGLQLVQDLTKQLHGRLEIEAGGAQGTSFSLAFKPAGPRPWKPAPEQI